MKALSGDAAVREEGCTRALRLPCGLLRGTFISDPLWPVSLEGALRGRVEQEMNGGSDCWTSELSLSPPLWQVVLSLKQRAPHPS